MNGVVTVKDGTIRFKGVKKPLEHVDGTLRFSGQSGEFLASGNMGKGGIGISSDVKWSGHVLTSYAAALQADATEIDHEYFKGPVTANLTVSDKNGVPHVQGTVDLRNDTVTIPLLLGEAGESSAISMDVAITAGEKVRLYNSLLYDMYVEGTAYIRGRTDRPFPDGELRVTSGEAKYFGTKFKIEDGSKARFTMGSFLPVLDVSANANVSEYRVQLELNGLLDAMEMKLTSEPYLEQNQIVSLLTFGKRGNMSSNFDGEDAGNLLTAGLQMVLMGTVESYIKDSFGLDRLVLSSGYLDTDNPVGRASAGYYNIEIGKYLLPDMMLTLSRGLNYNVTIYGIEYDIAREFGLRAWRRESERESDDKTFVGGYWRHRF